MRTQKELIDKDAWGLVDKNIELNEVGEKLKSSFETLKKDEKVSKSVMDFMKAVFGFVEKQKELNLIIVDALNKEAKENEVARTKVTAVTSELEVVTVDYRDTKANATKARWAEDVKRSSKQIKLFGVDFKTQVRGFHELKKEGISNLIGMTDNQERIKGELNRHVSVRALGSETKDREEVHTVPLILECATKEKKWIVEEALRKEIPKTMRIAYQLHVGSLTA